MASAIPRSHPHRDDLVMARATQAKTSGRFQRYRVASSRVPRFHQQKQSNPYEERSREHCEFVRADAQCSGRGRRIGNIIKPLQLTVFPFVFLCCCRWAVVAGDSVGVVKSPKGKNGMEGGIWNGPKIRQHVPRASKERSRPNASWCSTNGEKEMMLYMLVTNQRQKRPGRPFQRGGFTTRVGVRWRRGRIEHAHPSRLICHATRAIHFGPRYGRV